MSAALDSTAEVSGRSRDGPRLSQAVEAPIPARIGWASGLQVLRTESAPVVMS